MAKKLSVVLTLDDKQFQSGLRKASKSLKNFGKSMKRTGETLSTNLTLPIAGLALASVKMAASMEESLNKTRVAFGDSSAEVEAFAKTTLTSFGIAESSALDMSSLFGDMATSMGLSQSQAAQMATTLVGLAGNLASFKDIGIEQAQTALSGIFTGQTEALTKLGIVITEANLKQFGFNKNMTQAEKIGVRYKAVMAASENALGDFERTSESLTNKTRTLGETLKELGAEIGEILIPSALKVVKKLKSMADSFRGLSTEQKEFILKIAGIAAAIGPLLLVLGQTVLSLGSIGKALIFISANPMVAFMTAITTLTGLLGFAILDMEGFIKTALNLGNVGRMVAKAVITFADATGLMSKVEATAAIATINGISKESKNLETSLDGTTNSIDDQKSAIDELIKSFDDMSAAQQKAARDAKKVREIPRIEPIQAGPITDFTGGMSAAPQLEGLGLNSDWFKSMEKNLVKFETTFVEKMTNALNSTSKVMGEVSSLFDLQHQKRLNEIEVERQAGIDRINSLNVSEEQRAQLLENLEEKIDKKKAQAQKKQAKREKAVALLAATVNTAAAVVAALPNVPLSIAIGALGAAQIATIAGTPIPEFAEGGIISGPTIGLMGEYAGARTNPEVIAPLDKLQGMLGNSEKVVVEGVIRGEDIVLSSERYNRRLNNF
jgi:uncharacterized membrane protein